MSNLIFNRKEFESLLGAKVTKETEEKISLFGTPLERITEDEIEIEIFPNRPDMLSMQGFLRGFKAFLGKETGLKKYKVQKPEEGYTVKISPSVKLVRPFTACAIVKNLKFNDEKIKEIIDLQEKLHSTIGRNRKKLAIGIYPLEKNSPPWKWTEKWTVFKFSQVIQLEKITPTCSKAKKPFQFSSTQKVVFYQCLRLSTATKQER